MSERERVNVLPSTIDTPVRRLLGCLIAAFLAFGTPSASLAEEETPEEVIEQYHGVVISVMQKAHELGYEGRFDALKSAVTETFDLPLMSHLTVGRYWGSMSEADRERFVAVFSDFSVATMASRFDDYSGQRFELLGRKESSRDDVLVFTALVKPKGEKVDIVYRLRFDEERWRVIDVFLDSGISEIATRRSEYTTVIRRKGIDTLIAEIQRKVDELAEK